ncbi:hypothetical protein MPL3365_20361 [Mesorhizobium plurifarium]|uniref:Uncharacterized protein n=1 Tax=Mesorhizobium plurifarium TaxID=69974 RepID=A0A090G2C1_MESPL|nr:hypothetical protein MPL3365_20361 [Mesorhizobium plurifarium]
MTSLLRGCRLPEILVSVQSRLERLRASLELPVQFLQFLTESRHVLFLELLGRGASS